MIASLSTRMTRSRTRAPVAPRVSLMRRVFSDKPERSGWLRALAFVASAWAVLTLVAVGAPPLIPVAALGAIGAGHFYSYRRAGRGSPLISLAIGIFIVALGIYMRNDLVAAIRGDRIPVTYFLLATGGAASFDLRTRASLYTQLIFAGIVTFFASEIAFAVGFGPLLAVFGLATAAFFARAWLEDEISGAQIAPTRLASRVMVWSALGVGVIVLGIVAFMLMPWNAAQTPHAPQFAVLPFSGTETGDIPPLSPEVAKQLTRERQNSLEGLSGPTGPDGVPDTVGGGQATGGPGVAGVQELGKDGLRTAVTIADPLTPPGPATDETVMYVRSPVASYWRGRTYDTFNPGADGGPGEWTSVRKDESSGLPPPELLRRPRNEEDTRYLQTFFLHQDTGGTLLAGYEPLAVAIERDEQWKPVIGAGSTYQVISSQPPLSSDSLRNDRSRWLDSRYSTIPEGLGFIHKLSAEVTRDATTHFDRAAAIASYLHQLPIDEAAPSQLESTASLEDFVFGDRPGTSLDFATAMVMMARASGLTSRVATGYLPGEYNALSGANKVTGKESHVWAEVYFDKAGWVPFDPAPRTDVPVASAIKRPPPSGGLSFLLEHRFGDDLARAATRAPAAAIASALEFLESGVQAIMGLASLGAGIALTWLAWRWLKNRRASIVDRKRYATFDDAGRRAVRRAFRKAEARVARSGFRRRLRSESYGAYADAVRAHFQNYPPELGELAALATQAAYSSSPLGIAEPARARELADSIDARLRVQRRRVGKAGLSGA